MITRKESAQEMELPTGTVTFLFTDMEGSTRLWDRDAEGMRVALVAHDRLIRTAIEAKGGVIFKTIGDAFCAAFRVAKDAVDAAIEAQKMLATECPMVHGDPVRVRMAIHSGTAEQQGDDYFGSSLNRVARIIGVANGGQIVLSLATEELCRDSLSVGITLRPLGSHRLKDLARPEQLFQICHPVLPEAFSPIRSLSATPNNLPEQLTSFIGREAEIARVRERLAASRLVTLVGTGGCGKTRLSLQVAADVLEKYPDGVFFAELAPVADGTRIAQVVAAAAGVREEGGTSVTDTLIYALHDCKILVILDNCEHLVADCARLADTLLRACPRLTILASSREPLGIHGETVCRVPSLSLPEPDMIATAQTVSQYESVRLFVERASAILPSFVVTNQSASAVAQICYRLDGIPLAIELAAARVRTLSVNEIAPRLSDRFHLLTGGSRTALRRQQTLRGLIDWSYDLLSLEEKILLARLSVFPGRFTLASVEEICSGEGLDSYGTLDALTSLVDKSLALWDDSTENGSRYRLLQTVREYAQQRLEERGETELIAWRHVHYYAVLAAPWAERAERDLNVIAVLPDYLAEQENVRHALHYLRDRYTTGDTEAGETLFPLLRNYACAWGFLGYYAEADTWLPLVTSAAETGTPSETVTKAVDALLSRIGFMHETRRDTFAAGAVYETLLRLRERQTNIPNVAKAHLKIGDAHSMAGRFADALSRYEQGLALLETVGDALGAVWAMEKIAYLHFQLQSDNDAARYWFQRGLDRHPTGAMLLDGLGMIAAFEGDFDRAKTCHEHALAIRRDANNDVLVATSLNMCGTAARERGDFAEATRWHRDAIAIQKPFAAGFAYTHSLGLLALAALGAGDTAIARTALEESLAVARNTGHRVQIVTALYRLAQAAIQDESFDEANTLLADALLAVRMVRDSKETGRVLVRFAYLEQARGNREQAARIFGAVDSMRRTNRERLFLYRHEEKSDEDAQNQLHEQLGNESFDSLFAEGRLLGIKVIPGVMR
ncbi:MAG: tetratricopeptide repeat protein [Fibrella sp.]|nr:tetratricopeptide repeat protein [Armatimonadota bacterium]